MLRAYSPIRLLTRTLPIIMCGLMCGLVAAVAAAQTTGTIKVDSRIVLLDVSVMDASGKPVLDLRQDEFRVTERKVPQTIASFEPPSAHTLPAADAGKVVVNSSADLPKIAQAPVTVLILDELNMDFPDRAYARTKLLEWLGRQPAVLPQPTALTAIDDVSFHVLRDYTQDRDALLTVLKKHTGSVSWRHDSNGRTGSQASENMFATLGALEQIAQATRGVVGRKNVIWVGDGFPSVSMGDVGRTSADEITAALRRLSTVMLKARVTLSIAGPTLVPHLAQVIETQGDQDIANVSGDAGITLTNDNFQFGGLAPPTGGKAYGNRNDLDGEIGESVANGASYYTLSYKPTDASDDPKVYRRIHVEVTRPGLTVTTRDGYFQEPLKPAEPAKIPTQQLAFDLYGAALSSMSYTDMHVTVERKSADEFTLHALAKDMTWRDLPDGRRHTDLVLLAVCLSPRGKMLSKTFSTLGSNTEATLSSIELVNAALPMKVVLPPGTARIRFVVRDMGAGRVGTADYTP